MDTLVVVWLIVLFIIIVVGLVVLKAYADKVLPAERKSEGTLPKPVNDSIDRKSTAAKGRIPAMTRGLLVRGCPVILALFAFMFILFAHVPPAYQYLSMVGVVFAVRLQPYERPLERLKALARGSMRGLFYLLRDGIIFVMTYVAFLTVLTIFGTVLENFQELPAWIPSVMNFLLMFFAVVMLVLVRESATGASVEEEYSKKTEDFVQDFEARQTSIWGRSGATPFSRGTARMAYVYPSALMSAVMGLNLVLFAHVSRQSDLQLTIRSDASLASLVTYATYYLQNSLDALTLGVIDSYDLLPMESPLVGVGSRTVGVMAKYVIAGFCGLYVAVVVMQVRKRGAS